MLTIWFLGLLILSAFATGLAASHIDTVIPLILGRRWHTRNRSKRLAALLGALLAFLGISALVIPPDLQREFMLPEGFEWISAGLIFGVAFQAGVTLGWLLLKDAHDVMRMIIESMFPRGGPLFYNAEEVNAADRILAFLDRVGGPYGDMLQVVASGINSPLLSWIVIADFTRFSELSEEERIVFIARWMKHENLVLRSIAHAFKALGCLGYYSDPRVWKELDYPGPFVPQFPDATAHNHLVPYHKPIEPDAGKIVDPRPLVNPHEEHPEILGLTPVERRRRRYRTIGGDEHLTADVCIIGSGAGGAVLAYELSRRPEIGRVVVLERGGYNEGEDFNQRELDMLAALWKGGALTFNRDFSIFIGQGETLGGTTVINHAICIDTPQTVTEEWKQLGAGAWITDRGELDRCLNEVKAEIGVNPVAAAQFNRNNQILRDGAVALGIPETGHGPNPRNCRDCRECGFSHLGCHYDAKQSTLVTYLPMALDTGRCTICCDTWAQRITFRRGLATGVDAVVVTKSGEERYRLRVDAKLVIVAAGTINSTAILLRSKTPDPYRQLGRGVTIHPSPLVIAEFDEPVRAYAGIPMSYHVREYSVLHGVPGVMHDDPPVAGDRPEDQRGGFMLEAVFPNIGQFAAFLPGIGIEHKKLMSRLNLYAAAGILIRDTPKGQISLNWSGDPIIDYHLDVHDRQNLCNGIRKLVELYFAVGAHRVIVTHREPTIMDREAYSRSAEIVQHLVRPENCGQEDLYLGAVHPQGGNRLGTNPKNSVVDEHCVHHQIRNLVVCDASVFPTATGVNPMLTIMGIAKRTAEHIISNWPAR